MTSTPPSQRPPRMRSAAAVALAVLVAVLGATAATVAPATAGTAMAASPSAERAAEALALRLVDDARVAAGLRSLRADATVTSLARARADDMRVRRYFAHAAPDGTTAFDLLDRSGIAWSAASEAIGWNDVPDPAASATRVVRDWLASGEHADILLAPDRDTIGLAAAFDPATGRRTWVLLVVASPTPTPPGLDLRLVRLGARDATGARLATVRWSPRAATGSAPVATVTVQVRPSGGRWSTVAQGRAATTLRVRVRAAGAFEVRIRARGPAGTVGPWSVLRVSR